MMSESIEASRRELSSMNYVGLRQRRSSILHGSSSKMPAELMNDAILKHVPVKTSDELNHINRVPSQENRRQPASGELWSPR